jgi:kynurenine formamidase
LEFIRDTDTSVLVWDMMDMFPNGVNLPWSVHGAIFAFGIALVDNALLEPLADACSETNRWEFLFMASPLRVQGGTGSPANPLALL